MVARLTGGQEVAGSNPVTPTKKRVIPQGMARFLLFREDLNLKEVFALKKQFGELFLAKRCAVQYRNA